MSAGTAAPGRWRWVAIAAGPGALVAAAVALLELISRLGHHLPTAPLAASLAIVATVPSLPAARPRNILLGHALSALVGAGAGWLIADSTATIAVAAGASIVVLTLVRTPQPPAIATACVVAAAHLNVPELATFVYLQVIPVGVAAYAIEYIGALVSRHAREAAPVELGLVGETG